jgi:hypothetical protein
MLTSSKWILALLSSALITQTTHATVAIDDTPLPPELHFYQERSLPPELHIQQKHSLPAIDSRSVTVAEKRPIFIFAFIHDDVPASKLKRIRDDSFIPLQKEIKSFSGRRVHVEFIRNLPTYTDFSYKHNDEQESYNRWRELAANYQNNKNLPLNRTTKFILITHENLNSRVGGIAGFGQPSGIASLTWSQNIGHEVGHMLDATHEQSEVLYRGGWWCDSYMVKAPNTFNGNCHVFTDANRARISAFLSNVP